jgi:hypothetical protein
VILALGKVVFFLPRDLELWASTLRDNDHKCLG